MGRPLIYKLTSDGNGAPCVTDDLLTLAICKHGYREDALRGDFLFGFMGRSVTPDRSEPLVYIAEVTEDPLPVRDYYDSGNFVGRADMIYRNGELLPNPYHDESHRESDLGKNEDANVLLSKNFRYFGIRANEILLDRYPNLTDFVYGLNQTNHPPKEAISNEIVRECEALIGEVWLAYDRKKVGERTHEPGLC
jgi:hypothetical protein